MKSHPGKFSEMEGFEHVDSEIKRDCVAQCNHLGIRQSVRHLSVLRPGMK